MENLLSKTPYKFKKSYGGTVPMTGRKSMHGARAAPPRGFP
jgi:hypothetical protein